MSNKYFLFQLKCHINRKIKASYTFYRWFLNTTDKRQLRQFRGQSRLPLLQNSAISLYTNIHDSQLDSFSESRPPSSTHGRPNQQAQSRRVSEPQPVRGLYAISDPDEAFHDPPGGVFVAPLEGASSDGYLEPQPICTPERRAEDEEPADTNQQWGRQRANADIPPRSPRLHPFHGRNQVKYLSLVEDTSSEDTQRF